MQIEKSQTATDSPRIGYIGVDVLNNATVCNEAIGLMKRSIQLEVASVYPYSQATFFRGDDVQRLAQRIETLYPLGIFRPLGELFTALFVFNLRLLAVVWAAVLCPAEKWRAKAMVLYHILPAVRLALRWRSRGVQHIHAHWAHTATTIAMHASQLLNIGFSFTGHANDLFVHRIALREKVRRARFIVAISEFHRDLYVKLGGDPERIPVVYCGIDMANFTPRDQEDVEPDGRPRIVSVGRLVEKKGFGFLIEACKILADRGVDFTCTIAGSGPLLQDLREHIHCKGLEDRVSVTGEVVMQDQLPDLLRSADAFVLPCVRDSDGDMDGLPQVLIEAMACGAPVISTRLVGIPDLVRDGRTGFLVQTENVEELAEAMIALLAEPVRARGIGAAGAEWVRDHFSREETVRRLAVLFQWAARTPPGREKPPRFDGAPTLPPVLI